MRWPPASGFDDSLLVVEVKLGFLRRSAAGGMRVDDFRLEGDLAFDFLGESPFFLLGRKESPVEIWTYETWPPHKVADIEVKWDYYFLFPWELRSNADDHTLVIETEDTIRAYVLKTGTTATSALVAERKSSGILSCSLSDDGMTLDYLTEDGELREWELATSKDRLVAQESVFDDFSDSSILASLESFIVVFETNRRWFVGRHRAVIVERSSGRSISDSALPSRVTDVQEFGDGRHIVVGSADGSASILRF